MEKARFEGWRPGGSSRVRGGSQAGVPEEPRAGLTEDLLLEILRKHPGLRVRSLTALALGLKPWFTYGRKARLIEQNLTPISYLLRRMKAKGMVRYDGKKWYPALGSGAGGG